MNHREYNVDLADRLGRSCLDRTGFFNISGPV